MQRSPAPILGLIGLAVLCFFCVRCHAPRIQAELADQGKKALAGGKLEGVRLEVDGRDATLMGVVASAGDRDDAVRWVAAVPGIRSVSNQLELPEPVRFELDRAGGAVALHGRLPKEAQRQAIVSRARDLWGAAVTDELQVDAAVEEPGWLAGLPDALAAFDRRTEGGTFAISGGELTIGGRMFAASARRALLERLAQALPGLSITDRSEVRPPATAAELQAALEAAVASRTVEFASASAALTDLGRSVLDEIFELLSSQEAARIGVSGHTDDQGNDAYNLDLSRRRAVAARDYLVAKGLAAGRFEIAGFGEARPIADNTTPEGRLKNRRIDFAVREDSP